MDLFILRHGKAGTRSATARGDSKRPLTVEGKNDVDKISRGFDSMGIEFDYVFTSPLLRSKQTAEIVFRNVKCKNPLRELNELKPEANRLQLCSTLASLKPDSSVLLIGHEPYLSELIGDAISNGSCRINLKKGGLARIKISSLSPKIQGELQWLFTPKYMKKRSH